MASDVDQLRVDQENYALVPLIGPWKFRFKTMSIPTDRMSPA